MIANFTKFARFPWATQCLEMSKTTGHRWLYYDSDAFAKFIKGGDFDSALQRSDSVGSWYDSVQGHDYWENIYNDTF